MPRKWSQKIAETSDALDLEPKVFAGGSAKKIAGALRRSAEHSRRRKGSAFQSAMSMLTFYLNRAGKSLPASRRRTLEKAKDKLRKDFGRSPAH
jgi:Protein of unknown function (DUF3175)